MVPSAFGRAFRVRKEPLELVIAGRKGWLVDDLFDSLTHAPLAGSVIFTGYLPDEDLCALYSSCTAFVYPSIYEGFGLPPLEAMACGAPVIASRIPAIEEVVGSAGRFFSPESTAELSHLILELVDSSSTRKDLAIAGCNRAVQFSWSRTATANEAVYAEARERFTPLRTKR